MGRGAERRGAGSDYSRHFAHNFPDHLPLSWPRSRLRRRLCPPVARSARGVLWSEWPDRSAPLSCLLGYQCPPRLQCSVVAGAALPERARRTQCPQNGFSLRGSLLHWTVAMDSPRDGGARALPQHRDAVAAIRRARRGLLCQSRPPTAPARHDRLCGRRHPLGHARSG